MSEVETIPVLVGSTFTRVYQLEDDQLFFEKEDGTVVLFYHEQSCCEHVYIESVVGELEDLIGVPIEVAEERTSHSHNDYDSITYTFYTFRTIKGTVDVRWVGTSNGYYSESVDIKVTKGR